MYLKKQLMSHLIWKRCIGKRSSQVCPLLPGSARQVGFLSPGFPSRSGGCRVYSGSKQYQSLTVPKPWKNKLPRTRILLPALFFVLITQQYGWTFEKKSTNTALEVWPPRAGIFHLVPSSPAAACSEYQSATLMCSGTAEGVPKPQACCMPGLCILC